MKLGKNIRHCQEMFREKILNSAHGFVEGLGESRHGRGVWEVGGSRGVQGGRHCFQKQTSSLL